MTIEIFWYAVGNTSGSMHKKSWVTRKSGKCRILRLNTKVVFFHGEELFLYKWNGGRGSILQQIIPKLLNIVGKVLYNLNASLYTTWNKRSLHICMSLGSKTTVFIFGHLPANPTFWKRLSSVHGRVYQKEQALEVSVSKCSFSERTTSYELHAIALVLWN